MGGVVSVNVAPASLNFGSLQIFKTSAPLSFVMTHTAHSDTNVNITFPDQFMGQVDGDEGFGHKLLSVLVPAGGSTTINVIYLPDAVGAAAGNVTITNTANVVALSGVCTAGVTITPVSYAYGQELIGIPSADVAVFKISNITSPHIDLVLEDIVLGTMLLGRKLGVGSYGSTITGFDLGASDEYIEIKAFPAVAGLASPTFSIDYYPAAWLITESGDFILDESSWYLSAEY